MPRPLFRTPQVKRNKGDVDDQCPDRADAAIKSGGENASGPAAQKTEVKSLYGSYA